MDRNRCSHWPEYAYVRGGVPLVNPTHVQDGKIVVDPDVAVSVKKAHELAAYRLQVGDIVLGRRGEMGRAAVVHGEAEGYLCGTGAMFIRTDPAKLFPSFLCLVLRSPEIAATLQSESVGSTMTNLNRGILTSLDVPCPSIMEQECVVRRVEDLFGLADAIEGRVTIATTHANAMTKAILARAFAGELVPPEESAAKR